ncbi:hypothetical protein B0H14DRAFT_2972970 [Mycena olivaceomarginata]|nr:hypothetical protein B0H14DRAFT_2972970 [Mycena olivaceomarginata]
MVAGSISFCCHLLVLGDVCELGELVFLRWFGSDNRGRGGFGPARLCSSLAPIRTGSFPFDFWAGAFVSSKASSSSSCPKGSVDSSSP